ncbi:hypothetical protein [Methanobacterium aggregans]|uniref:hypothetical protein n=1 Tax=Methanobacterium aggregans TaxID=1615586 RepID=UPI001AE220C4|nr:hypothetical protein [Methanobacterium aggregans]MBP2045157.1 hypothetical protein [Methanobacterium aggregans]
MKARISKKEAQIEIEVTNPFKGDAFGCKMLNAIVCRTGRYEMVLNENLDGGKIFFSGEKWADEVMEDLKNLIPQALHEVRKVEQNLAEMELQEGV